jgi:two-component system cell cycle sensor histidine kinase/response regulator CckA
MTPFTPEAALLGKIDDPLRLLEGLFEHSPVGVQLYDVNGHSLFVNKMFLTIFGVIPPPEYSVLRDEIAVRLGVEHLIRAAFDGKATKLPVHWYDPRELSHVKLTEGRRCAIECFMFPILDSSGKVKHVVFFHRDVTLEASLEQEKKLVEKKLADASRILEGLMHGTQAVIYAKDLEGRYIFVNQQYGRVLNLPTDQILGRLQSEIHPPEVAEKLREADRRAEAGPIEVEETVAHPDGVEHEYLSLKFPLTDSDGKVYGVCGVSTDITTVRQLEKDLGQAQRMQSLGLLAGGIAHDFNNLLGMILLHTESLTKTAGEAAERDLGNIRGAVERASGLVRQLLAFGGRIPMKPRVLNLNTVLTDLDYMIHKFAGEAVPVELHPVSEDCNVCADPTQVEQVLLNLCVNSRDALGGHGRIRISTGFENIHAGTKGLRIACAPGRYAWFEVDDDGPGMNPNVLERAFDPFFTTKARKGGSGLGLASVFGIVRESGGTLRVSTAPGFGCAVRVYLPATRESVAALEPKHDPQVGLPANGTVILVEDEPLLREITGRILRQKGFRVLEARDASEVPALLHGNPGVTLLLTDVIMPGKSGPALVKALERDGLLNGVGVVFISGYSSDELGRYGFTGGDMHLLEKPFTTEALLSKIRDALSTATQVSRAPAETAFSPFPPSL